MPVDVNIMDNACIELQQIVAILKKQCGYDFSHYKPNGMFRNIQKRMKTLQIDTLSNYIYYIYQHPPEAPLLAKSLLIHVTNFFRDEAAFEVLKNELLSKLLDFIDHSSSEALCPGSVVNKRFRVWIPGCSTGEEAYSVAIILQECFSQLNIDLDVRIFATDCSEDAIEMAREGVFSDTIEDNVSAVRLQNFFTKAPGGYKIKAEIRKMIIFVVHNLIEELPFTKLDLLCCRNLFIYLEKSVQNSIIPIFHHNLNSNGLLLLGVSENIGESIDLFNTIDNKWRLYKRKNVELTTKLTAETSSLTTRDQHWENGFPSDFLPKLNVTETLDTTSHIEVELSCGEKKLQTEIEELKATNEESQAMNEELQSVNESLLSHNLELQHYIDHLFSAKIEINNLLNHMDTPTIFLDKNCCIKHFTPKATEIINLISSDVGRPINHLVSNIPYQDLTEDSLIVLETLEPIESQRFDKQGDSYLVKMRPYLSTDNIVSGVVVTYLSQI